MRELDMQGWNGEHPVFQRLLYEVGAGLVVEVGTYKGQSARTMGRVLRPSGGRLVCVDTWLGSDEFLDNPKLREWLEIHHGLPSIYWIFLSNMVRAGLEDVVVPFPQTSWCAARWFRRHHIQPDAVYLDASHDEDDVALDLRAWWPLVREGGLLFGDDYNRDWPGVVAAVDAFGVEQGLPVEVVDGQFWVMRKPRQAKG